MLAADKTSSSTTKESNNTEKTNCLPKAKVSLFSNAGSANSPATSFVFGQNLHERVVGVSLQLVEKFVKKFQWLVLFLLGQFIISKQFPGI